MKIKKIKFNNHKVLKNLEVDFISEDGNPLDIVVFIGDNGTGKTQLLESIVDIVEDNRIKNGLQVRNDEEIFNEFSSLIVTEVDEIEGQSFWSAVLANIEQKPFAVWIPAELKIGKVHGANRKSRDKTKIAGTGKLIEHANEWRLEDVSDYIIDIIDKAVYTNRDKPPRVAIEDMAKMINNIFEILNLDFELVGVATDDAKTPKFKNRFNGDEFDINGLSSGEKQLFFKILSLKRLNVHNAIILIDEPETSLHPEWQRKIIEVYKQIGENNQFIIATHSPFIIGSVPSESIRKLVKDEDGNIKLVEQDASVKTYGKTVDEILEITMGLDSLRNEDTTKKIEKAIELLESDAYETKEYKELMAKLKKQMGTADKDIMLIEMEKSIKNPKESEHK